MEGIVIFALGIGVAVVARRSGKHGKAALGWVARQSGYLASRVRSDVDAAKRLARDEFVRARDASPPPPPEVVVSEANTQPRSDENPS